MTHTSCHRGREHNAYVSQQVWLHMLWKDGHILSQSRHFKGWNSCKSADIARVRFSQSRHSKGWITGRSVDTARVRFSHYLGVSWNRHSQVWQARFHKPDGTSHLVGDFKGEEEAGRAYDEYALKQYGNEAVRNNPPSTYTGGTRILLYDLGKPFCLCRTWTC